jgi:D-beta-D-heptose 7-phosphate kinase/D-beta-D-heptose 1-phosphate adenosyltransferase
MLDLSRFQKLHNAKILVVGDVMLDRYFLGDSQRISPEAPVPVVNITSQEDKLGGAANVARNIAHLNGNVGLLGIIGHDDNGRILNHLLQKDSINSELVEQQQLPTITKLRVISRHQQVVRLDFEEKFSAQHSSLLAEKFLQAIPQYDSVIISDYNKGSLTEVKKIISAAKAQNKYVLVDPKQADLSVYAGADIITPNLSEFRLAGGDASNEEVMLSSARTLLETCGIKSMLLTRSEKGMSLITPSEHIYFPAEVHEVSDVTGAGDTVISTLAVMLGAGFSLRDATQMANIAAGIVVGKLGAATVAPPEIEKILNQRVTIQEQQPSFDECLQQIEFAKFRGEKIVFTNGCFDILHAGHVRYLQQARALGDRLVLGLNSDASVKRLKGESRPINTFADRQSVLAALACVDWVIPFGDNVEENDTPLELIKKVAPHILVKGGDYQVETIVGAKEVLASGGEVIVLDFLEGRSTTNIIKKIQS